MASSRGALLALGVRGEHGLGSAPVDIYALIQGLGIRLHRAPAGDGPDELDGMYLRRDGEAFIFVNTSKWLRRQRLTAAHELGHHYLVGEQDAQVEIPDWAASTSGERAEEADAFAFARELLIDRAWVREHLAHLPTVTAVERAVRQFEVSPEAAVIQLCDLEIVSPADKAAFLAGQHDAETRLAVRPTPPKTNELAPDPTFGRKVDALEEAGILAPGRARELREHARPRTGG